MKVGFIKPVHQAKWIANVAPVPKKDGKVRMCVDFRDLNKAYLKYDFLLPYIDVLVDNLAGSALLVMPCCLLWMVSQDITKSRWLLRT